MKTKIIFTVITALALSLMNFNVVFAESNVLASYSTLEETTESNNETSVEKIDDETIEDEPDLNLDDNIETSENEMELVDKTYSDEYELTQPLDMEPVDYKEDENIYGLEQSEEEVFDTEKSEAKIEFNHNNSIASSIQITVRSWANNVITVDDREIVLEDGDYSTVNKTGIYTLDRISTFDFVEAANHMEDDMYNQLTNNIDYALFTNLANSQNVFDEILNMGTDIPSFLDIEIYERDGVIVDYSIKYDDNYESFSSEENVALSDSVNEIDYSETDEAIDLDMPDKSEDLWDLDNLDDLDDLEDLDDLDNLDNLNDFDASKGSEDKCNSDNIDELSEISSDEESFGEYSDISAQPTDEENSPTSAKLEDELNKDGEDTLI